MATNEYTNLTIIDCNRQHSIQAKSGNNENLALFTNEIKPLKLKVGDKVSVQGMYISEIGAGSDTVEFKGQDSGKKRTINYTQEVFDYPTTPNDRYSNNSQAEPLITGYQSVAVDQNASLTYDIKDNETYITTQYYLNNSGDSGYISLPRRYAHTIQPKTETDWNNNNWTRVDSGADSGRPYKEVQWYQYVQSDYMWYDTSTDQNYTGYYKLINDNSRFTLMKRLGGTLLRRETVLPDNNYIDNGYPPPMSGLLEAKYVIFKDIIKVSVDKGFNSPATISQVISQQLKEADDPVDFLIKSQDTYRPCTQYVKTQTFKPQLCASYSTFNSSTYDNFDTTRGKGTNEEKEDCFKYYSNFYNIYDKRPEIRIAGQELNDYTGYGNSNTSTLNYASRTTDTLQTHLEFTEDNLIKLKNLFSAQKIYPELFSNINAQRINPPHNNVYMSVDNARYLHMNTQYNASRDLRLGGDNITYNASTNNQRSLPVFFYFDKNNENKYTDGIDTNDLCYGFATKYFHVNKWYIELHPELIGGINQGLYIQNEVGAYNQPPVYGNIAHSTIIGYDYSFNAYGSAVLCGFSGRLLYDYNLANLWGLPDLSYWKQESGGTNHPAITFDTSGYMRYNYVGTNNPKFEYDSDNSRFYFSDLHTPELAGQAWTGAGDSASGVSPQVDDNTNNGGAIVYKINKRVNPYTYTPDMRPYEFSTKVHYPPPGAGGSHPDRDISKPNRSIATWKIFDSQTGIYISDFGYNKEDWDNGLWGILGFTYEQFNSDLTNNNNRISRIVNTNLNKLNLPTTNSEIVSTDTRDYIVNQFGAVYYTTQLPSTSTINTKSFLPAISQNTESIKIRALNLPRKMLRPYYCIRSDIIDKPHYVGGNESNNLLSVVGVCDKQYSGGDFYFSSETDFEFTITKERTITNITTSIHDPDQSFSNVNSDSAVIYKIQSRVVNDLDIAQQLFQSLNTKKK